MRKDELQKLEPRVDSLEGVVNPDPGLEAIWWEAAAMQGDPQGRERCLANARAIREGREPDASAVPGCMLPMESKPLPADGQVPPAEAST